MQGLCPRGVISCIGRYKRNLISLQSTKLFFFVSQFLNILQLGFVAILPHIERNFSAETIFWVYNILYLGMFVGELVSHIYIIVPVFQILSATSCIPKKAKFFMTKPPKNLEPRSGCIEMQTYPKHSIKVLKPWKEKRFGKGNSSSSLGQGSNISLTPIE